MATFTISFEVLDHQADDRYQVMASGFGALMDFMASTRRLHPSSATALKETVGRKLSRLAGTDGAFFRHPEAVVDPDAIIELLRP